MKKWVAQEGKYTYTIDERAGGNFDLTVDRLGEKLCLWFTSYKSAGRMKQINE